MKRHRQNRLLLLAAGVLAIAGLMFACTSKSPSEPSQQPGTPPGTGPASGDFAITLTASPSELPAGGADPSAITIQVRRRDNGQAPPSGTTIVVSTNLGDFNTQGSGTQSQVVELLGGNAQVFLFAGGVLGTAIVQARLENSIGQIGVHVVGAATFFLSYLQPNSGTPDGGDVVDIVGGGFAEPVRVTFAGVVAQVQSVSTSRIRVVTPRSTTTVPSGQTLPVNVAVTVHLNEPEQISDNLAGGFTYVPGGGGVPTQPQVLSLSPTSGPNEGNTRVAIVGSGFQAPVQVIFGLGLGSSQASGVEATVESVSASQIVVRTPAATGFGQGNQNQTVDVLVKNLNSGLFTVAGTSFRYGSNVLITAFAPDTIAFDSQAHVTISGQGFDAPVAVGLAGVAAQPLSVTGTEVVVRAGIPLIEGCMNITGPVSITNIETGDGTSTGTFTYVVPHPVVTGVAPSSGTGAGGTLVTISGINLTEPLRVFFGDSAGSIVSVSPGGGSFTATTPSFNMFDEEACQTGDGQPGSRFVPTAVDVQVVNLLTTCEDTLTGGYTYTPTDSSCRANSPPTPPVASFSFTSAGLQVNFIDTSTGGPTAWNWDFGDTMTSTMQNPVHIYAAGGNYTVTLTITAPGGTASTAQVVTVP
jgi:PKD domain/IPT/TIG domain